MWLARLAGIIMAVSYIPQQVRIIKNRSSKDISISMFAMVMCAILLYEMYAFSVREPVMMWTNSMSLIMNAVLLILVIKYRNGGVGQ